MRCTGWFIATGFMRLAEAHRDRIVGDAEAALGDGWPVGSEARDV